MQKKCPQALSITYSPWDKYLLSTYYVLSTMPGLRNHQKTKQVRSLPSCPHGANVLNGGCSLGPRPTSSHLSHPVGQAPFLSPGFSHSSSRIPSLPSALFFSVGGTSVPAHLFSGKLQSYCTCPQCVHDLMAHSLSPPGQPSRAPWSPF